MTPLPNTIRDLRVLATPRPCTILLQFPPPISTPLGSRRSLAVFPPFCLHPYLCPPHTISPAPPASTSLPPQTWTAWASYKLFTVDQITSACACWFHLLPVLVRYITAYGPTAARPPPAARAKTSRRT